MLSLELNEHTAEDFKQIEELRKMGVPEEVIQMSYNNTQNKRKAAQDERK